MNKICKFCKRLCKNNNSLSNHRRLCKLNPDRKINTSNIVAYNNKRKILGIKGCNQYTKAAKLGLSKPSVSIETRRKISLAGKGRRMSPDERMRRSIAMKKAVKDHPDSYTKNNVVGRVKIVEYNGTKLKGSWEVLVAQWFDAHNIRWEHEAVGFKYFWNGDRTYFPDFFLPELNVFVEVKGYESERDRSKWLVVPNLIVIKRKQIEQIKQNFSITLRTLIGSDS